MSKIKFIDKREDTVPTFGDLQDKELFTDIDNCVIFIKVETMYDDHKEAYNTIGLNGEFYWFDDDEEIRPIQEIEIIIKR